MQISLKHSTTLPLDLQFGCILRVPFTLRMFSASLMAAITIVQGVYFLPSPSKSANSKAYLHRLMDLSVNASLPSVKACNSANGVVRFMLNLSASMMLPSMFFRSLILQLSAVTSMQFLVEGGQIYSYLLAIHREVMPTSWQSSLVMSLRLEQSARQLRARQRVCSFSSKDSWTSTSQSTRIMRIFQVMFFWMSRGSTFSKSTMKSRMLCLQSPRGSLRGSCGAFSLRPNTELERVLVSTLARLVGFSNMLMFLKPLFSRLVISLPKNLLTFSLWLLISCSLLQELSPSSISLNLYLTLRNLIQLIQFQQTFKCFNLPNLFSYKKRPLSLISGISLQKYQIKQIMHAFVQQYQDP